MSGALIWAFVPALCVAVGPWLLAAAAGAAATDPPQADPRARLAEQRRAIEAAHEQRVAECQRRFVVTACVDAAREQRRRELAPLREREMQLDAAERERRAAERREAVELKQREAASRIERIDAAEAASAARPARVASPPRAASAPVLEVRPRDATSVPDERAREAAERAERRREREAAGQARRDRVAEREMERSLRGRSSEPLPPPPPPASGARR